MKTDPTVIWCNECHIFHLSIVVSTCHSVIPLFIYQCRLSHDVHRWITSAWPPQPRKMDRRKVTCFVIYLSAIVYHSLLRLFYYSLNINNSNNKQYIGLFTSPLHPFFPSSWEKKSRRLSPALWVILAGLSVFIVRFYLSLTIHFICKLIK
jgi:hypothetical protein